MEKFCDPSFDFRSAPCSSTATCAPAIRARPRMCNGGRGGVLLSRGGIACRALDVIQPGRSVGHTTRCSAPPCRPSEPHFFPDPDWRQGAEVPSLLSASPTPLWSRDRDHRHQRGAASRNCRRAHREFRCSLPSVACACCSRCLHRPVPPTESTDDRDESFATPSQLELPARLDSRPSRHLV